MSVKINLGNNVVSGAVLIQPAKGGSLHHKIVTLKLLCNGRKFEKRILLEGSPDVTVQLKLLVSLMAEHIVRFLLTKLGTELNILLLPHTEQEAELHGTTIDTPVSQDDVTA